MRMDAIEADYVIVGAGAVGMACADTLLAETDASIAIVDRHHAPGGHWNVAYPFITLHAPSTLYGVNSRPLESGHIDSVGMNRGLQELASGASIIAYYEAVMRQQFLPSGRVTYLPESDYRRGRPTDDDLAGEAVSLLDGRRLVLRARRKLIDATYADTRVPATHPPAFEVAPGVACVAPGEIMRLHRPYRGYVIIGGGKTAMDTAVWLLGQGVDPDAITWIRPREAWVLNRAQYQTNVEAFERTIGGFAMELELASRATSIESLFAQLEAHDLIRRIDRSVTPTMYRCAIVSDTELEQMRRIRRVVRLGHVRAIRPDSIVLEHGVVPTSPDHLHIHCCTDGIPHQPKQPVFQPGRILLQYVRRCSPRFSAAFIAHLEATVGDDATKNALCGVIPLPQRPIDWLRMLVLDAQNTLRWAQSPALRRRLSGARLNAISRMAEQVMRAPTPEHQVVFDRYRKAIGAAVVNLTRLIAQEAQPVLPTA